MKYEHTLFDVDMLFVMLVTSAILQMVIKILRAGLITCLHCHVQVSLEHNVGFLRVIEKIVLLRQVQK